MFIEGEDIMKMRKLAIIVMVSMLVLGSLVGCAGDRMNSATDGTVDEMDMLEDYTEDTLDDVKDDTDTVIEDGENIVEDIVEDGKDVWSRNLL